MVRTAGQGKDFNEALQTTGELYGIQQVVADAEQEKRAREEAERQAYLQTSTAYQLQSFIDDIEKSKTATFFLQALIILITC